MTIVRYLILAVCFLFFGCSTIKDARENVEYKTEYLYKSDFDHLWADTIKIVEDSQLDLVYQDKLQGNILAQSPISSFSWGENVFIKVYSVGGDTTGIKVSSYKSLATNITATNWEKYIIKELDIQNEKQ